MTITVLSDLFNPEILTEAVAGVFAQKTAFMGSALAALGVVVTSPTMAESGPGAIGKQVTVPYFGTIGAFVANADGSAVTPNKVPQTSEVATVARTSLAFEVSRWAQGNAQVNPNVKDPYQECAEQIMTAATRSMDAAVITAASAAGGLQKDIYSLTSPTTMNWDLVVDSKVLFGDEQDSLAALVCHSHVHKDLMKLKDSTGRPLLIQSETNGGPVDRFCGLPVVISDRVPLTGSTMTAITATGTTPPAVTISGTPLGPWNLVIDIVVGGTLGVATFRFSSDGGNTWSATIATGASVLLTDSTVIDSLVGVNGATGITALFAAGTYNADNLYTATAQLKVTSFLCKQKALAFWYNKQALRLQTFTNILSDSDQAAMHLYAAALRYRRLPGGTRPGLVQILHNVSGY